MVARAGYAITEQLVAPERILLLSFNTKAADELRARIRAWLGDVAATTSTFHAFGRRVIGAGTGKMPALSKEAQERDGLALSERLADNLRAGEPGSRRRG